MFPYRRSHAALALAGMTFALGLTAGAWIAPGNAGRAADDGAALPAVKAELRSGHPAEVLRVIDGDTFEARVRVWPGMDVTTLVRLRGVDAPELRARCNEERKLAEEARDALTRILAEGSVGIAQVMTEKYGGRVVADASTRATPDVSTALLKHGVVRRYGGARREGWCG